MNKMFGPQYDYLSISAQQARTITHDQSYIKSGNGKEAIRKIYSGVEYDQFEQENLSNLRQNLGGVASHYPDELLYRWLYSFKFVIDAAVKGIKVHEQWLNDPKTFTMNPGAQSILDKGIIYIAGRDKKMRPSVVFQCALIDSKNIKVEEFLVALNTVFMIVQQYIFYPGSVENWIILIDTNEIGLMSLPIEILKQIISVTSAHYVGNLEKLYLLNPSTGLSLSWGVVSKFIDERSNKKIQFLNKKEFPKLMEYFDKSQLEQQFGGTMPKITTYWPPQSTIPQANSLPIQESRRIEPYQQSYQPYQAPFKKQDPQNETINLSSSINRNYFENKINPTQPQPSVQIQNQKTFGYDSSQKGSNRFPLDGSKDIRQISFQDQHFASQAPSQRSRQIQPPNEVLNIPQSKAYVEKFQTSKTALQSQQFVIHEEPERKSQYISEQKNPIEEPTDRKSQLRKSYRSDYQFSKVEFQPPFPSAIPNEPIVYNGNNNYKEESKVNNYENLKQIPNTYSIQNQKYSNYEQGITDNFDNQQQNNIQDKPYTQNQRQQQQSNIQKSQPPSQSQSRKLLCLSARDGKYTACNIQ